MVSDRSKPQLQDVREGMTQQESIESPQLVSCRECGYPADHNRLQHALAFKGITQHGTNAHAEVVLK